MEYMWQLALGKSMECSSGLASGREGKGEGHGAHG